MAIKLKFVLSVVAKEALRKLGRDNGSLYAAAVSFFGMISMVPLMLLAIGVLGYLIGSHEEALDRVMLFASDIIPVGTEELDRNLRGLIRQPGVLGGLGLLGFLWTGMQIFVILRKVMNLALGAEQPGGFLRTRGVALAMALVAGMLFAISLGFTSLLAMPGGDIPLAIEILRILGRLAVVILTLILMYRFLPARNVGNIAPLIGGSVAGVLFVIATYVFRWYALSIADYTEVYGTLAGVVVLLLWIYYASLIVVIGAELTSVYAEQDEDTA